MTIITEILKWTKESKEGIRKTNIMWNVNLNYPQVNRYLRFLLTNGYLCLDSEDRYKITEKGLEFMKTLESLNSRLQ